MTTTRGTAAATLAAQARTIDTATRSGEHCTTAVLEAVAAADRGLEALAALLGRTYYATLTARRHGPELAERAASRPTRRELPADRGWTTLEAMGF